MSIDKSKEPPLSTSRLTAERFRFVDNGYRCESMWGSVIERSQVASEYEIQVSNYCSVMPNNLRYLRYTGYIYATYTRCLCTSS